MTVYQNVLRFYSIYSELLLHNLPRHSFFRLICKPVAFLLLKGCRICFCKILSTSFEKKKYSLDKHQAILLLRLTHVVGLETKSIVRIKWYYVVDFKKNPPKSDQFCFEKLWYYIYIHIILFGFKLLLWQWTLYKCIVLQK